jgi:hypothetical protein
MSTGKTARRTHHRVAPYLCHLVFWWIVKGAESYGRSMVAVPPPSFATDHHDWRPRPSWWRCETTDLDAVAAFANERSSTQPDR